MTITTIVCKPGEDALVVELPDRYEALVGAIGGGWLLEVRLAHGIVAYVDDDGIHRGLPWNRKVGPRAYLAGPIVVTGLDEEKRNRSLTPAEQEDVLRLLNEIAKRLEPKPSSIAELESWLGERAVRSYWSDATGDMREHCTDCGEILSQERKGFCPKCGTEAR